MPQIYDVGPTEAHTFVLQPVTQTQLQTNHTETATCIETKNNTTNVVIQ